MPDSWPEQIIDFWFNELKPEDWWKKNEALDRAIKGRFGGLWSEKQMSATDEFLASPQLALSAVILFDQFPRNMFRSSAKQYATDKLAQSISLAAVSAGLAPRLLTQQRHFLYMPLMHAEDLRLQEKSLSLFARLGKNERHAREHHSVIAQFGRFPHRNDILNRQSTAEELQAIADGAVW